jgi:ATP-dependent Clp protease ATP-binding subunit ClpC
VAEIALDLGIVIQRRRDGLLIGQAMLIDGTMRVADSVTSLKRQVARAAEERLHAELGVRDDPASLQHYQLSEMPTCHWLSVEIPPLGRTPRWSALTITMPYLRWRHAAHHRVLLPSLALELVLEDPARIEPACREQVIEQLVRLGAREDLRRILDLCQSQEIEVARATIAVSTERADPAEARDGHIDQLRRLCRAVVAHAAIGMDAHVRRLAANLGGRAPRSALLVGLPGVGKTALVRELARRAEELGLGGRPLLAATGSSLVAGMTAFGMWQERLVRMRQGAMAARAILHLGRLRELVEVGQSSHNQQGLAEVLRPWIAAGDIQVVCEATPEDLAALEVSHPALIAAFEIIHLRETAPEATSAVLAAWCAAQGAQADPAALDAVVSLHRRFAAYSAAPGRPLDFLRDLARERPQARIARDDVIAAFTRASGIPAVLIDDRVALDPDEAQRWFASRILAQEPAVAHVVDLLLRIKGGLARADRPLASLLLAGPTGVGKTEMAKALAEYLYGDRGRLTRFDMSEFASMRAAISLVGHVGGGMGKLVAAVRREPFSVILLDEIEKAHPAVFDLLLQALGEGRLSDASGHSADLRSSVVIMTSNLGVAEARRQGLGFTAGADASARIADAIAAHFRPEFVNRIDGLLVFDALGGAAAQALAERELGALSAREGLYGGGVSLRWTSEVAARLARLDEQGARGLKRRVDQALVLPLAEVMNRAELRRRDCLEVTVDRERLRVAVVQRKSGAGDDLGPAEAAVELRRRAQRLSQCPTLRALAAELARFENLRRRKRTPRIAQELAKADLARMRAIERAVADAHLCAADAITREADLVQRSLAGASVPAPSAADAALPRAIDRCLLTLWTLEHPGVDPARVLLVFSAREPAELLRLAAAYAAAIARGSEVAHAWLFERDERGDWQRRQIKGGLGKQPPPVQALLALEIGGGNAYLRWSPEAGVQGLEVGTAMADVRITATHLGVEAWTPPEAKRGREAAQAREPCFRQWVASRRAVIEDGKQRLWRCTEAHRVDLIVQAADAHGRRGLDALLGDDADAADAEREDGSQSVAKP